MRNLYGVAKTVAFVLLGVEVAVGRALEAGYPAEAGTALGWMAASGWLMLAAQGAVWLAVVLCVVRGIPVLMDGRAYLVGPDDGEGAAA